MMSAAIAKDDDSLTDAIRLTHRKVATRVAALEILHDDELTAVARYC